MINFNGVIFREYFSRIRDVKRSLIAPQEITTLDIPGRAGAYFVKRKDGVRMITARVMVYAEDLEAMQAKFRTVKSKLIVDKPAPIIFEDEPGVIYHGMIIGDTAIDQVYIVGEIDITFICFNPYGDATTGETISFVAPTTPQTVNVTRGDMPAFPIYEFTIKQKTTSLMARHVGKNKNILLGLPENLELQTVDPKVLLLHDDASSLTPWVTSTKTPDGGTKTGTMAVQNGSVFYASTYGTGASWHGPMMMRDLSKALQDFEIDARLTQNNAFADRAGRVEVYLTDLANGDVAKFAMKDVSKHYSNNAGEVRVGSFAAGVYVVSRDSKNSGWWNNFYSGKFILRREGKKITGRVARVDNDGNEINVQFFEYYDAQGLFAKPFQRIHVHIAMNGTTGSTTQTFDDVKVYELNVVNDVSVPVLANVGDKITINTKNGEIRKNGEVFMDPLNGLSDFFTLEPGVNEIEFFPPGVADVKIDYIPRFR